MFGVIWGLAMTISTTASKVTQSGNGVTTVWPYTFEIPGDSSTDQTNVIVTLTDTATGVETVLATNQYSITGINSPTGGNVTYPLSGSALAVGNTITIQRNVPYIQSTDFPNQSAFYGNVVTATFDYAMMCIQQLKTLVGYSLQAPITDAVQPGPLPAALTRATHLLGFDAAGDPEVSTATVAQVDQVVSAAGGSVYSGGQWITAGGTANALTAAYFPAISFFVDGTILAFRASLTNTAAVTFIPNGLGSAKAITRGGGVPLAPGTLEQYGEYQIRYSAANDRWELLDSTPGDYGFLAYNAATVANQTGNAASVNVPFATEVYDRGSCYAANVFTALVPGLYEFVTQVAFNNVALAMTNQMLNLNTSGGVFTRAQDAVVGVVNGVMTLTVTGQVQLSAGGTASVSAQISNGAGNTAGIFGAAAPPMYTFFSGRRVA
jgi:hypothetical protein